MLSFKEMSLTVFRRQATKAHPEGEGMVTWEARDPLVGEDGLRYLSFYFTLDEWVATMDRGASANDIGHNLRVCGDLFTFFDLDFSRETRGVVQVPFVSLTVPYYVRRVLRRAVDAMLKRCLPDGERIKIDLPFALRERWARQYGQGKGTVQVDASDETREFLARCEGTPTFDRSWSNVQAIARNTTARHTDVASVRLAKDWDGFYWVVRTPSGQFVMNGGIINHGRDGEPSWSVHT